MCLIKVEKVNMMVIEQFIVLIKPDNFLKSTAYLNFSFHKMCVDRGSSGVLEIHYLFYIYKKTKYKFCKNVMPIQSYYFLYHKNTTEYTCIYNNITGIVYS